MQDWRPQSPESVAAATLILCVATLAAAGQAVDWGSAADTLGWMLAAAPPALGLGVGLQALYRYAEGQDVRAYLRALRAPVWWLGWARLWLSCWVVSFAYFWLKLYVPRLNGARFDGALWQLDRALHLGLSPTRFAVDLLGSPALAGALDAWYALWLASLVWCLAFFAASRDERTRRSVVLSCLLLWGLGSWFYVLVPASGPAFVFGEAFAGVADHTPRAAAAQVLLWKNHQLVLAGDGPNGLQHTLGIAALPSLHVGFHVLFTLWARAAAPLLFWPFAAATVATFAGSLLTGWHYAIDGYVGAGLAVACFILARRLEARVG